MKQNKKIKETLKVTPPAGAATPAPPLGPALGQRGVNIKEFTNQFNEATKNLEKNTPVPTIITIYKDRTFSFIIKTPPVSYLIKKAAQIDKGAQEPGRKNVASISQDKIREIAQIKIKDLNTDDIESAIKIVSGSARSIGINLIK